MSEQKGASTIGRVNIEEWYANRNWQPFPFQLETANAYLNDESGLLNAPTGSGKTLALWLPCLAEYINECADAGKDPYSQQKNGLRVLWITPLRALTHDIERAMKESAEEMGVPWSIASRTGDTKAAQRQKLRKHLPECLLTTPESLHLMLASKQYAKDFQDLKAVIIDEWHELLGTKRGVQMELALSRLRAIRPGLKTWGISATVGNMEEAAQSLLPVGSPKIVRAKIKKALEVVSILPDTVERFPWAGHLGTNLLDKVIPIVESSQTTLLFTNTRAQTEIWYQRILDHSPQLAGVIAMHHGSLDNDLRAWVEAALHAGKLKLVVCTSSLDLGVDFRPVETVIQVGSPKGVARFLQRAGRSGHQPGETSRIYFLPTHSLELVEAAALRQASLAATEQFDPSYIEARVPVRKSFDVLTQYLVTLAVSDGFDEREIFEEVRHTYAYRGLSREEWKWALAFISTGGKTLHQYEEYRKVQHDGPYYKVNSRRVAMRHRMSIGTIVSDPMIKVKFKTGGYIGSVEESFVSRLKEGQVFWFAGRGLKFLQLQDMTCVVQLSNRKTNLVPRYGGGRLPLSTEMAELIRQNLERSADSLEPELQKIKPLLELQRKLSAIPKGEELLIEQFESEEGHHLLMYPFEGWLVHEALSALVALRIGRLAPITFSIAINDYGFELLSDSEIPLSEAFEADLFTTDGLLEDIRQSINDAEMAKRRFRDIAAISGLTFKGMPNKKVSQRNLQVSSGLLFDVFADYDPDNLLIRQAFEEVLRYQLEQDRLVKVLNALKRKKRLIRQPVRPTPFAFPIMVDRLRGRISSETLEDRVAKMQLQFERVDD